MINVRIRNGMRPNPSTGEGGATEGDIRGSFSDIIDVVGVKDLVGGHCAVTENSPAALSVLVAPGIVYIPNANYDELDSNTVKFWEAIITVPTTVVITANTSGSTRIDLICAKMDTAVTPDEHASNIATLVAVAGTPGAGVPATPDNYAKLAEIEVVNGASTIVNADITDSRVQSTINSDYISVTVEVTADSTTTFTNKRINPRVVTAASYTTDTGTALDVSTCDEFDVTAQAGALKLNNPGGTPVNGQKIIVRIKDDGTPRALTSDTQFRASSDLALPTTTFLSKTLYMGFIFNSADTKWDLLAVLNNI